MKTIPADMLIWEPSRQTFKALASNLFGDEPTPELFEISGCFGATRMFRKIAERSDYSEYAEDGSKAPIIVKLSRRQKKRNRR